jgi:hypothetical protein
MRFFHLSLGVLLLGSLLLCSCAGRAAKKGASKERLQAGTPSGGASLPPPAWQTRLGRVVLVNSGLDFVLIDTGTSPVPEPGTLLRAYSEEEFSAELSVSTHQQRPFLIADILSGKPRVSDMVVPVKSDTKPDEGRQTSKSGREAEGLPQTTGDGTRKERFGIPAATPTSRQPVFERPDSQELPQIERRPPPSTQSLLSPGRPAADESQAIIPGLPSSGKNPPR